VLCYSAVKTLGVERPGLLTGVLPVSALVVSALLGTAELTAGRLAGAALVGAGIAAGLMQEETAASWSFRPGLTRLPVRPPRRPPVRRDEGAHGHRRAAREGQLDGRDRVTRERLRRVSDTGVGRSEMIVGIPSSL
jgi:hypothetical protein